MLKLRNMIALLLLIAASQALAQQRIIPQVPDSVKIKVDSTVVLQADSVKIEAKKAAIALSRDSVLAVTPQSIVAIEKKSFKPDPKKAVLYSVFFPGLGQIYNRKYWKLPIIYGGFVAFAYAITWNNGYYQDYFNGYKDIMDDDPTTNRWHKMLPYGQTPESVDKNWFSNVLKDRKNRYRYYRDFNIIGAVALYGLAIVDAYVDAQLFEFDVSPDLSMRIEPVMFRGMSKDYLANSYGFKCSFSF